MPTLSPGKVRGLQNCATPEGIFAIVAADHRDALRAIINPAAPPTVTPAQLTAVKLAVTRHVAPAASAVLLDPVFSAGQAIMAGSLPGRVGLLCALEEQGYLSDPHRRRTPLISGWSVAKTKRLGANGVKLLLFYHPRAGESTQAQEQLVQAVAADCRRADMPFFLEPILYSPDPALKTASPEFAAQRPHLALEMVQRLGRLGPDVLKIEYPVDPAHQSDPAVWAEACAAVNAASPVPWTILSGGGSFEQFTRQLEVACRAGCAGFVAGRSVWQEAATLSGPAQTRFLQQTALPRVQALRRIAVAHAAPWFDRHEPAPVDEQWYHTY